MEQTQNGGAPVQDALNVGSTEPQVQESQVEQTEAPEQESQPESKQTAQEAKKLKQLKLKVYGQEVEEELPFEIDDNPEAVEYLTKQLQLAKAAQKAMQDSSSFQKQVQSFFNNLKGNTKEALEQIGIDPKEFAAAVIEEEIKKQQMSPEERERQELQAKVKKYEEDMKKRDAEFKAREQERLQEIHTEKLNNDITTALDKGKIPQSSLAVKMMANYMSAALAEGYDTSVDEIAEIVRKDIQGDLKNTASKLSDEELEEWLGKEVFERARKRNIAKAKTTPASVKSQIKDVASPKQEAKPQNKQSMKDFFKGV